MKSHDYHVFLQCLLPLIIRGYLPKEVREPLIELGVFFRELCADFDRRCFGKVRKKIFL